MKKNREKAHDKGHEKGGARIVLRVRIDSWRTGPGPSRLVQSEWGADDEKGAANLITPELVEAAAKLVKIGKTYPLGGETNAKSPSCRGRQPGDPEKAGIL